MKEKTKKTLAAIVLAGAGFGAGVYFSGDVIPLLSHTKPVAEKGFYKDPYNLKIDRFTNRDGKIEVYLKDAKTGQSHKIGNNMYVGDANHNAEGAIYELMAPLHEYNTK